MTTRMMALDDDRWDIVVDCLADTAKSYRTLGLTAAASIVQAVADDLEQQHQKHYDGSRQADYYLGSTEHVMAVVRSFPAPR